jgi:MOSC domain-containing protein YiiM
MTYARPVDGRVTAVSLSSERGVSKAPRERIRLLEGLGVEGDVHLGEQVRHRSRMRKDPTQPNLRQVHLVHSELHAELAAAGFSVAPGQMGENITTEGIDLLSLPAGTRLVFGGSGARVEVTGLRNPCSQLDGVQPGLMAATLERSPDGALIRKAGVMGIVVRGGEVAPGDAIEILVPAGEPQALMPV